MALNFFVLLTLLKFGLSAPDPNVKVGVNVEVEDNGNNCCGDKSCIFGGIVYPHKCNLKDTCINMQCIDGTWKFKGINEECGKCKVEGDPHIYPYDNIWTPNNVSYCKYLFNETGEYVITQPGFHYPALFGVTGTFDFCSHIEAYSCIRKITYYEPGIHVELIVPPGKMAANCVVGTPGRVPACDIKVLVNKISIGPVGSSVQEVFGGFGGAILVFKHTVISKNNKNMNCMTIVGTKGVSVSLCEYYENYPYLYVWPMPSLKSPPKTYSDQLYGLCGTWTGNTANDFVMQNTTSISYVDCLTYTPLEGQAWDVCDEFSGSWETSNIPMII